MTRFFMFSIVIFALLAVPAAAAEPRLAPMDAAAGEKWLPDTVTEDGIHMGSWSANGAKPATAAKPAAAAAKPAPAPADGGNEESSHSLTVTSIQTCYDQLDPADAADIKRNFLKPYAECQARLEAKLAGKREWKAGEAASAAAPETPRNYIRVQQPDVPAGRPVNTPTKSMSQ